MKIKRKLIRSVCGYIFFMWMMLTREVNLLKNKIDRIISHENSAASCIVWGIRIIHSRVKTDAVQGTV